MGDPQEPPEDFSEEGDETPSCFYDADHAWVIDSLDISNPETFGRVSCRDCSATLTTRELLDSYVETQRMVSAGVAVITGELETLRHDQEAAARELMVDFDEMPPGSTCRRLVIANKLLRDERDKAGACEFGYSRAMANAILQLNSMRGERTRHGEIVERACVTLEEALAENL